MIMRYFSVIFLLSFFVGASMNTSINAEPQKFYELVDAASVHARDYVRFDGYARTI